MSGKKLALGLTLFLVAVMVITACRPAAPELAKEINLNLGTEPPTLDPCLATDTTSVQVDEMLFLGLTNQNEETTEVEPELATKWEVSADGLTWTFYMRKDVKWVHYDPATKKFTLKRPVTAHDVEYGVKRTLDPATASDYAYVLYVIKGAEAFNTGETTDPATVGVKAIDDYTVQFTLEYPAAYFPLIAGMWVARPVPKEPIEQFGDKWTEPGNIWSNGPYALEVWEHENRLVLVKNPHWWGAKDVAIERINFAMITETSTAFAKYEAGELDVAAVPLADIDRVKADPVLSKELHIAPILCTYYYGFNVEKPPFDNVLVRKAFSFAVDRKKLVEEVTKGGQEPAMWFTRPGIFGSPDPKVEKEEDWPHFDPELAKKFLADAGYPGGKGLPEITLMYNTSEGHKRIAEAIQQMWKEVLGVEVKLANQEWKVYLKTLAEDPPQIWRLGWCQDYPDANNFLNEVFHSQSTMNHTKWGNPEFDRLVEEAAKETDPAKRKEMYRKAEQILVMQDAAMIPIYWYTRVSCTKPYVERTFSVLGGLEHFEKWKVKKH